MSLIENTDVWYEKYRPQSVDDVVLPQEVKDKIKSYIKDGGYEMPHLGLFSRTPGTGKSSLAKAILSETKAESLFINASLDRGIDVLRTKIQRFASNKPLRDAVKIVVMDEFDSFSREGQAAFRGFIDEFGSNVRFIFTGNYKENIIEPLLDRLEVYDFNQFDMNDVAKPIFERLRYILDQENVEYEPKDVVAIIKQDYPRIRKMIGSLKQCTVNGKLQTETSKDSDKLEELGAFVKAKNYQEAIKAVYSLGTTDHIYGYYGDNIDLIATPANQVNAIIVLAKYQHMSQTARDKNLNAAACIAELAKL